MPNEFVIKNGFISKDNSIVEGGLTANTINASGININGNLTVTGNTSLQSISGTTLDISGNTSSNIVKITQTGSGNAFVVEDDTNPDSSPFVIDASGNTGIGTLTPNYKLHVSGDTYIDPTFYLRTNNIVPADINQLIRFKRTNGSDNGSLFLDGGTLRVKSIGSVDAINIFTDGNLGVRHVNSSGYTFDVNGTSRVMTSMRVGDNGNTFGLFTDNSIGFSRLSDGGISARLEAPISLNADRQTARVNGREGVQLSYDTSGRFQVYQLTSTIGLGDFDIGLTNDTSTILRLEGTKTPFLAVARGANFVPILSATSNNDTLIGLDINPTFQNSSFTGVTNLGLRVNGNTILGTTTGDATTFGNGIIFNYNVNPRIFAGDTIIYQSNNTSRQHYFVNDISSGLGGTIVEIGNGSGTLSTTTNNNFLNISGRLVSTSGANDSNAILISSQVGNGGTYSGITRGLYYNPSIIGSGFTHRAIETTTGDVIFGSTSGNVGIGLTGTTSPTAKLHINNTTSGNTFLAEDDTNPDSSPFVIDASGNTGIGTLTPLYKLDVNGNSNFNGDVLVSGNLTVTGSTIIQSGLTVGDVLRLTTQPNSGYTSTQILMRNSTTGDVEITDSTSPSIYNYGMTYAMTTFNYLT